MISHKEYYEALKIAKAYKNQIVKEVAETVKDENSLLSRVDGKERFKGVVPEQNIYDTHISIRLLQTIRIFLWDDSMTGKQDFFIKDLSKISLMKFSQMRNVGKKTIQELKDLCECAGVTLQP